MGWLDIVILVMLVIPTFIGMKAGIIKAILSLAGVIVGVILAGHFYTTLAGQLTFITQRSLAEIVAFGMILIGVMIVAAVAAALIKWVVSAVMMGWVNRLGGAVFGFFVGAVSSGAMLTMWANFLGPGDAIANSALAQILLDTFPIILALLPAEFDSVRSFFQ